MTRSDVMWTSQLVLLSLLTSHHVCAAQTTPPPPCDEAAVAQCLVPLQSDSTFAAVLTPSNAFNLVTLAKDGEKLCQSFLVVSPCLAPVLQACSNTPSDTYSAVAWAMTSFCTSGRQVLSDFPCLTRGSFLDKVDACQQAAGLYSNMAEICQTTTTLRRCVDANVIADCDVMAAESFQALSEAMLLPLRLHYGCTVEPGPGPNRKRTAPLECGTEAADCMRHLQDLSGTSATSTSLSVLLTLAPRICRAYSNLQQCAPRLGDCSAAVRSSLGDYTHLDAFCTLNITALEQHQCLQERATRETAELCDRGYTPSSDIDISTCRYIHQHQSCLMAAIMTSCTNDTRSDVAQLIEKAFAPRVRVSRCATVLVAYTENQCLDSDLLEPRFRQCINVTVTHNGTVDCSAFPALTRCAELAVTATCGQAAVPVARPLIERVGDFATIRSGCKSGGVNTGTRRPASGPVQFVKDGMVTPITVAVGFLVLCILITLLVLSITYCMVCRNPNKHQHLEESHMESKGSSKRSKRSSKRSSTLDSQGTEVVRGTLESGGHGEGGVGGGGESALELGEVRLQDQSIVDNGW